MNDTVAFEQMGIIDGPGAILRRSREAKGLDITAVAAMLHLSEFKINAIEEDDFDSLPEPVFVRGYLRNYARLLEEPVGPILDAYSRFGFETELPEQPLIDSDLKVEVNGDHDLVKILSVVVIAAAIIVPVALWWEDLGQAIQSLVSSGDTSQPELAIPIPLEKEDVGSTEPLELPASPDSEDASVPAVTEEDNDRVKTTIQLKPTQEPIESVVKEIEPSNPETKSIPIPLPQQPEVVEEIKPTVETMPEPIRTVVASPDTASAPAPAPSPKPKPAVVTQGVWFDFVDSGWVKVRDAKDRVILIGEHKKGTRKRLTSTMPYKVVLGNSNAVRVEIDGKVADVNKFSSGGVARFTIIDGKIDKP